MNTGSKQGVKHKLHATRQQDSEEVDTGTQIADTKHMEVNNESNKFTVKTSDSQSMFSTPCTSK